MTPEELYKLLPNMKCKGLCQDNCTLIPMSRAEWDYLDRPDISHEIDGDLVHIPHRKNFIAQFVATNGTARCPLLNADGKCSEYDRRPMICRLFGMLKTRMVCEHGCIPERLLTDTEERFYSTHLFKEDVDPKRVGVAMEIVEALDEALPKPARSEARSRFAPSRPRPKPR